MSERPSIVVLGFKTTYEKNRTTGLMDRAVDWVTYAPLHMAAYTQITDRVESLRPNSDRVKNDDDGKKIQFLTWRWEMIERVYKSWKDGHEIPLDGTPLAAWAGLSAGQADVFRTMQIKTVEQIATMPDSIMGRISLPGVRDIQKQAKAYLASIEKTVEANRLTELEAQNAALSERLDAAMALLEEQTKPKNKAREAA